jgi:mono/diheme cytochrome c family protein
MKHIRIYFIVVAATLLLHACGPAEGEFTGHEYMPDMGHSLAYEANVYSYYYYNTWDEASTFTTKELTRAGEPVEGTIARGYAGVYFAQNGTAQNAMMENLQGESTSNAISVPINGSVPYYYEDTPEDRIRATEEIIDNPFPITADGLARGKELYGYYCAICHGEAGDGMGYLVSDDNPNVVYPAQPANLINDEFSAASNGRFYHAIVYGLNVMGSYADKLSYEERWQVIHYIRELQAKEAGAAYNETENTFNPVFGTPAGTESMIAEGPMSDEMAVPGEAGEGEPGTEEEDHGGEH